jgi:hypothetical protein
MDFVKLMKKYSVDTVVVALLVWICTSISGLREKSAEMSTDINWLKNNQLLTGIPVN